mmetsp:Transcript_28925/g.60932  ORF Transcript_28925/g.60932 Transcript_28925/m.60932 type:complete len:86 (-) Transcript_28925:3715-3972(-)
MTEKSFLQKNDDNKNMGNDDTKEHRPGWWRAGRKSGMYLASRSLRPPDHHRPLSSLVLNRTNNHTCHAHATAYNHKKPNKASKGL